MHKKRILLVEDEIAIRKMLIFSIERAGFLVSQAENSVSAKKLILENTPDLIIVDWMLPDLSGLELIRYLRREDLYSELPIIMLTAKADERDKIIGLEGGADDYITKPFSTKELIARVKALLRRFSSQEEAIVINDLKIDISSHLTTFKNQPLKLGPTEFKLLHFFMTHPGRVFSRNQLLNFVWGQNVFVEERTVDVHIRRLRTVLEDYGISDYIRTVRGFGYSFAVQE